MEAARQRGEEKKEEEVEEINLLQPCLPAALPVAEQNTLH